MKIALIQMQVIEKAPAVNAARGLELLEQAARQADLLILPEVWTTGYSLGKAKETAERLDGVLCRNIQNLAAQTQTTIVAGSMAMVREDRIYNAAPVWGPDGRLLDVYEKIHLFSLYKEENIFAPGEKRTIVPVDGWQVGIGICYDLRFPELFRVMAAQGAECLVIPAEWPAARGADWRLLVQARALENQAYVVAVNCAGSFKSAPFYGHSMLVGPDGAFLAEAGEQEEILIVELERAVVQQARRKMSVLQDRRPDCYTL